MRHTYAASFKLASFIGLILTTPLGRDIDEASSRGSAQPRPDAVAEMTREACRVDVSPTSRWEMLGRDDAAVFRREVRMQERIEGREGGGTDARRVWSLSRGLDVVEVEAIGWTGRPDGQREAYGFIHRKHTCSSEVYRQCLVFVRGSHTSEPLCK